MSLTRDQRRSHYTRFHQEIADLCADNGVRSDLRTGRGRPVDQCPRMDRYLTHRIHGFGGKRAHYTVACLIALTHPAPGPVPCLAPAAGPGSAAERSPEPAADGVPQAPDWRTRPTLGTTLALAIRRHGLRRDPLENRLYTLTRLNADQLQPRLPGLADRLANAGVVPDFPVLLEDLTWWDHDRLAITTRWRESFYLTLDAPDASTNPDTPTDADSEL